ncbi:MULTISPECIES: putative cytokinetic ring protein SteA [unclassified Nocardioides]|uniref:putative cytokinetic ring protein SteA n=1 Tax=unclassified Nocardioides TaxID=2615069 RepID=UPI000A3ED729|nr:MULTISPECIES: putative cytokinetic ring protein SteA [unclassified Nocardioides]
MRSSVQKRPVEAPPGTIGTARVQRRTHDLLARLRPGDIAVVDHLDMDRRTAQALVDAGAVAVVDTVAIISGRYPNLGPQLLVEAGVEVVDGVGTVALGAIADGAEVRVHEGAVYVDDVEVARGRVLDAVSVADAMERARSGLATQLAALTHNSTELLRREQDLLLHGLGVPRLATPIAGRPVVVVAGDYDQDSELAGVRVFLREQGPVIVAVGAAADGLRRAGVRVDVVVLDADDELPTAASLRAARDVVVRIDRGSTPAILEQLDRLGVRPALIESAVAPADAALVVADAADPTVIVAVGLRGTLAELLDSQRPGVASAFLTRLKVGPRLVDGAAVPLLYSGRVRPWHLLVVMLAGLVALAAAISVTPVGHEWAQQWSQSLADACSDLYDQALGLFR